MNAVLRGLWSKAQTPGAWLLASSLLSRLLGFVASLMVSRTLGVGALGVYSSLLITAASPTTPLSAVLSNNATMLAARQRSASGLWRLLALHLGLMVGCAGVALLGCWAMLASSQLLSSPLLPVWSIWLVVAGLVVGQLLTQVVSGLCHGQDRSRWVAVSTGVVSLLGVVLVWPVLTTFGLLGMAVLATVVMLLPGVLMLWWSAMRAHATTAEAAAGAAEPVEASTHGVWAAFKQSLPNVGATVVNNATNWICCVYMVSSAHGAQGLGVVAIGLQWMALMLLPTISWGGRVMRALTLAHEGAAPDGLRRELMRQAGYCAGVSLAAGVMVVLALPWIAQIYKVDVGELSGLFVLNAAAATLAGINFVLERVYFCLQRQGTWLRVAMVAYAVQLVATASLISWSVWAVALGNLIGIALVLLLCGWDLRQRLTVAGR